MILHDLLQEAIGQLKPGERIDRPDLKARDLTKIVERIIELETALLNSSRLKQTLTTNPAALKQLDNIRDLLVRKIQLLNRAKTRPSVSTRKMLDILEKECSVALTAMRNENKVLYRGSRETASVYEAHSRNYRPVKDSNQEASNLYDEAMSHLGVRALRSNSIFTTSSMHFAMSYGTHLHMIFPKNGFDFLWTNTRDLVLHSKYLILDNKKMWLSLFLIDLDSWATDNVEGWLSKLISRKIKVSDWSEALNLLEYNWRDGNPWNLPERYSVKADDFVTPEGVRDKFDPNTSDFEGGISSGHEVLIRGEFWALLRNDWHNIISNEYFGGELWN